MDATLEPFADSIWTTATPIRFAGMWFPHVMTAVRLRDGSVLLHSPCMPSESLIKALANIGRVAHVVAPNWFHDLYLARYRALYPDAVFWGPSALRRRLGSSTIDRMLDRDAPPPWFDELTYVTLPGLVTLDESIFLHKATATLILADLLVNLRSEKETPAWTKFAYRISGIDGRLTMLPYLRWFRFLVASSLTLAAETIDRWNPDRLIVGHGIPIASGARAQVGQVFARSHSMKNLQLPYR